MQIISAEQVESTLDFTTLVSALKSAFSRDFGMPQRQMYPIPSDDTEHHNTFALLPAWTDEVIGVKSFTNYPGNPSKGLVTTSAQVLLFDRESGVPIALVDGTSLTNWRTAAVSALASSLMSREDSESLLLYGTGAMAPYMALAHAAVRPLKKIYIHGRQLSKMEETCERVRQKRPDIDVVPCPTPEDIITGVDIVSCATSASIPLFKSSLLAAGTHIDLVGNHHPNSRECDSATVHMSRVIVDSRLNVLNEAGEILIPLNEGAIEHSHILGELSELCSGNVTPRTNSSQITLFKSVGTALGDVASAHLIYKKLN
ncbi:ornithine cyclodeaminase family protein [Marinomonas mediterranea]|uniref:ornithine cyclodeaminase family protein n=1 Tax=Marinomonas mediterranea TaxID=119864 RepID=UPI00234B568C|nr:ornithine cyclodeaminase family protein [Marinomonas mediterranea]WCN10628.1 ornithine cyclodeaminase family protein [Marinomonas mediterranea]WCN14685.1 ornithine cyclodeaminase family protein [Marinomonas mediterranea]